MVVERLSPFLLILPRVAVNGALSGILLFSAVWCAVLIVYTCMSISRIPVYVLRRASNALVRALVPMAMNVHPVCCCGVCSSETGNSLAVWMLSWLSSVAAA